MLKVKVLTSFTKRNDNGRLVAMAIDEYDRIVEVSTHRQDLVDKLSSNPYSILKYFYTNTNDKDETSIHCGKYTLVI